MNPVQPLVELSTANARSFFRFSQAPEILDITGSSFLQFLEVSRTTYDRMVGSHAYSSLVHDMMENYWTFSRQMAGVAQAAALTNTRKMTSYVQDAALSMTLPASPSQAAAAARLVN